MSGMHFRQPKLSYNACGSFTSNKERIQKSKGTGNSSYIYQNKIKLAYNMIWLMVHKKV